MVRIWYDPDTNEFGMDSGGLSAMDLAQAGAMIVNGMAAKARSEHGEAAAEAMLMLIRNADDAAVFGLEAIK